MQNITVVARKREDSGFKAAVLVDGLFMDSVEKADLLDYLTGALSQHLPSARIEVDQQVVIRLDVQPRLGDVSGVSALPHRG